MTLHCPHCDLAARYASAHVFGEAVICPSCYRYFPWREARADDPANAPRQGVETMPLWGGPITILLAEDDDALRQLAQCVLEGLGYRVIAAADGQQALVLYQAHEQEIDLILSDMEMPKRSGGELYRAVRAGNGRVKFVLASASTAEEVRQRDDLGPGVPFIHKPWTPAQLGRVLRDALAA
jgi:CheY-like chemotaxis protein